MSRRTNQDIPAKKVQPPKRLVLMNINKGLNNLVSPSLIDNREVSDILNCEYDEGGVIRKRYGYVSIGNALTAAHGLGVYRTETLNQIITIDSGTLKYRTTGSWNSASGATFQAGNDINFTQARNKLFVWDGANGGAHFDGTTVTRPGTMPRAKFSVYYQGKHIAAGVDGQPSRLFISNISDATDFTVATGGTAPQPDNTTDSENSNPNVPGATVYSGTPALTEANVIDVRKNDGDIITALGVFQDAVIVFKERSIFQLVFDATGTPTLTPVTYSTGCVSHKTVKNVENDIYFLSREGHRVLGNEPQFYTAIRTSVLSVRVQPSLDSINPQAQDRANAIYFDNKYVLAYPTGTSESIVRCLVYDRRFQAYIIWTNFNAQDMTRYTDTSNNEELYFLDDRGTQVYMRQEGTYNDAGTAIEAYVTSKAQDYGNPDLTKFWIDLRLIFRRITGTVDLTVYQDNDVTVGSTQLGSGSVRGAGLNMLGTFMLGTDGETITATETFVDTPESVGLNFDSRTIKYKIYNNNLDETFVLLGAVYAAYPKSHYVFDSSHKVYL